MRASWYGISLSLAAIVLSGCCNKCLTQEDIAEQTAIPQPARQNPQPGGDTPPNAQSYPGYSNTVSSGNTTQPSTQPTTTP